MLATATRWDTHVADTLGDWLGDLTVNGHPVATLVQAVTSTHPALPGPINWTAPATIRALPAAGGGRDMALAMLDNPWHHAWGDASEILVTAAGRWLHPETVYGLGDGYAIANMRAGLYLGCVDKNAPEQGRPRYRTDLDPTSNDLGVIWFPLRPGWVVDAVADGCAPRQAAYVAFALAVVEAAVHEALETYQSAPGVPVVDPHKTTDLMRVDVMLPGLFLRTVYP